MMRRSRYAGNPNVGVFAAVNESVAFIASDASEEFVSSVERVLDVEVKLMTVAGSFVIGSLVALNSNGAVASGLADPREISLIDSMVPCTALDDPLTAAGNNILCNDNGAILSNYYEKPAVELIENALGVECVQSDIAGCATVGSVCRATNKGCICHVDATDEEVELLKDVLKVNVMRTTVNHGSRQVGAGVLANSKGAILGDETTPIEMGKVEDGLNLYRFASRRPSIPSFPLCPRVTHRSRCRCNPPLPEGSCRGNRLSWRWVW